MLVGVGGLFSKVFDIVSIEWMLFEEFIIGVFVGVIFKGIILFILIVSVW